MLKTILYEEDLPVKIEIISVHHYPIHMHNDIQLIYVMDGYVDLRLTFNTYRLKKNDFRYIHSEDIHSLSSEDGKNTVLILSADIVYLERIFPNIRTTIITMPTDRTLLLYHNQQLQLKYSIFFILDQFIHRDEGFRLRIKKALKTIFDVLYREFRGFTIDKENRIFVFKRLQDIRQTERLGAIIDDIYKNYVEPSTLEEIASRQKLNPYYLSHLFSQTIGINYRDFINMVRVETSEYELLSSELSVSHIALSSGFSNSSYYNKHFKFWFGMSPGEYRVRYTDSTIASAPPVITLHNLEDFADLSKNVLREMPASANNFSAEPVRQTIHINNAASQKESRPRLELVLHNPDLLSEQSPDFHMVQSVLNRFSGDNSVSAKIVIEEPPVLPAASDNVRKKMASCIQQLLNDLTIEHSCRFDLGITGNCETIYIDNTIKTPLYYLLQFLAQTYGKMYIYNDHVVIKNGKAFHVLCWNTNPSRTNDMTLKFSDNQADNLISINTLTLEKYDEYLQKINKIHRSNHRNVKLPEATESSIEQELFSESRIFTASGPLSLPLRLQCGALCFISVLPLNP